MNLIFYQFQEYFIQILHKSLCIQIFFPNNLKFILTTKKSLKTIAIAIIFPRKLGKFIIINYFNLK